MHKTVILNEIDHIHTAIAFGLSKLGYKVIVCNADEIKRKNMINHVLAAGGRIAADADFIDSSHWALARLVISKMLHQAGNSSEKKVRYANTCGDIMITTILTEEYKKNKYKNHAFVNLIMPPDWSVRIREAKADHHWSKVQKALGFTAAAAAASFASGRYDQYKDLNLISYENLHPKSFKDNLDIINSKVLAWRGEIIS